jgi:hypothetical protein
MLKQVNSTSNSSRRKVTMSLRCKGTIASLSHKVVDIGGAMVLGRPAAFDGAFVDPKRRTSVRL